MDKKRLILILWLLLSATSIWAQKVVTGSVEDAKSTPLPGVNVFVKGTTNGVITDDNGKFRIESVSTNSTLVFSFIGFETREFVVGNQTVLKVVLNDAFTQIEDVIVVGYGVVRKESVVGAITHAKGEDLLKSGGVNTVGQALSGKLPGVTTIASSGRPGDEQPNIYIRGRSTWSNEGQPLVLVDGIERPMGDIDAGDIESVSVLKDASATAVFGVKGANGVILITTKRGKEGKAQLSVSANSTVKFHGKLPNKLDSYDGIMQMNNAIERTLPYETAGWSGWGDYVPMDIANKYRNPANDWEKFVYPNIDWKEWMMKDYVLDHRINLSVRGGTESAKYYGAFTYTHSGDIFNGTGIENDRSYTPDFRYDRFNYRTNIDFDLTKTTRFSVNLSGLYGVQKSNDVSSRLDKYAYGSLYMLAPSAFYPRYDDGLFGKHPQEVFDTRNPAMLLVASGSYQNYRVEVNSDFTLEQKLDFILKGLRFKGTFAYDNHFRGQKGIVEPGFPGNQGNVVVRMINSKDGSEIIGSPVGVNQYDFVVAPWSLNNMTFDNKETFRKMYYQFAFNYDRHFGEVHNLSVLALMSREQLAKGSVMPTYREDWVARITYDYASRYFIDLNGAYNGSEKFGPEYRFDLFPSIALGWMVTNESFMSSTSTWLDRLKIRGSYGLVGDDQAGSRWAYVSQWDVGHYAWLDPGRGWDGKSPYIMYREKLLGNADLRWETAIKMNAGLEFGLFNNLVSFTADYFIENRNDILVRGKDRVLPSFVGIAPSDANLGQTKVKGLEVSAEFNYKVNRDLRLIASGFFTIAKDRIIYKEEPELLDNHLKDEGGAIGQPKVHLPNSIMTSWDDVYMSPRPEGGKNAVRPGYYSSIDFNGDGVIDSKDRVPFSFPVRPQNTWNATFGADYKNWSFMLQFYGAYNAFKQFNTATFQANLPTYFEHMTDYWTPNNLENTKTLPSWKGQGDNDPLRSWYDASYVKLKNIELSYTFKTLSKSTYKLFVNGNDLFTWSKLPDERQENGDSWGQYPMFRRVNIGVNINF